MGSSLLSFLLLIFFAILLHERGENVDEFEGSVYACMCVYMHVSVYMHACVCVCVCVCVKCRGERGGIFTWMVPCSTHLERFPEIPKISGLYSIGNKE